MIESLFDWLLGAGSETALFIVSMLPLIELRGAVPLGIAIGMPWFEVLPIAIFGNLLPIPFVLLFAKKLLDWLAKRRAMAGFAAWYRNKLNSKIPQVKKYARLGLILFVAVPIPGTGAWSGAAIAALLKMNRGKAFLSIALGVVIAGLLMSVGTHGLLGVLY